MAACVDYGLSQLQAQGGPQLPAHTARPSHSQVPSAHCLLGQCPYLEAYTSQPQCGGSASVSTFPALEGELRSFSTNSPATRRPFSSAGPHPGPNSARRADSVLLEHSQPTHSLSLACVHFVLQRPMAP